MIPKRPWRFPPQIATPEVNKYYVINAVFSYAYTLTWFHQSFNDPNIFRNFKYLK